jgi:glycolate oxidase
LPVETQTTLIRHLDRILGPRALLTDSASRFVYSRDASQMTLGKPLAVALPETAAQAAAVIKACVEARVPVVCRGTGTGLSGGALPEEGAVILATSRLNWLDQVDPDNCRVRTGPGVINDRVSAHAARCGLHFAPDPSSQSAASIGGNIAENAGGPHCLRHGVTLQHLRGVLWCDARGRLLGTGRDLPSERGFHLTSLLCGSEGTLGLVTAADLNLVPNPAHVVTLLAFFPRLDQATQSVVNLMGLGLLPVAVEIVDQAMLQAVEQAFAFGFPTDIEAAMICEFAGPPEEVDEDSQRAESLLTVGGAREVRRAVDQAERLELWKCRKKAFGAVGRLAPRYVTMDVVVPLGELPELVRRIQTIKKKHRVEIATAFHAGDGNLHPGVHYDDRDSDHARRAHEAADEIIGEALALGGSCTGEHGVGIEKLHVVSRQFDREFARLQQSVKNLFDPAGLLNPGKALPADDADFAPIKTMPAQAEFAWNSLTVTAPAETSLREIQARALERGLWIPVGVFGDESTQGLGRCCTVGDLVDHLTPGPALLAGSGARDFLLELWAETGDGRLFHGGAPVFKNVAGYDLAHALCGGGGSFARPRAATFQLRPAPEMAGVFRCRADLADPAFESGLRALLGFLTRRSQGTAGATCLFDRPAGEVTLVVAGRRRDWDLGRWPGCLGQVWPGLEPVDDHQVEFPLAAGLLTPEFLPEWALRADTWTSHAALPGKGALVPPGEGCLIWQSARQLWWSPDHNILTGAWFSDPFLVGGQIQPLPEPAKSVPLDLLRGLKAIFDPGNTLGGPAWLTGGNRVD